MSKKETTTIDDLKNVIRIFDSLSIQYWLDGGWGVDALTGKQSREHRDIDIDFDANYTDLVLEALKNHGYVMETDWLPVRAELYSSELGYIDVHPFVLREDGTAKQADFEGGWYEFEADYFGSAQLEGMTVPCISPKGQMAFHTGYELRDVDRQDIAIIEGLLK